MTVHSQLAGRLVARLAAATLATLALAATTPATAESDRKVTVEVDAACLAPEAPSSNACRIAGVLPGQGVAGEDLHWEVVLFRDSEWRVQSQAFSEGEQECQYPLRVWGSIQVLDGDQRRFVSDSPFLVGISAADEPTLGLGVDRIRIDTRAVCG